MKYKEIETFKSLEEEMSKLVQHEPSCFNGMVRIRKYRVTAELIEEPRDVLVYRLQKLWEKSESHHDSHPLQAEAKKLDYTFTCRRGEKA